MWLRQIAGAASPSPQPVDRTASPSTRRHPDSTATLASSLSLGAANGFADRSSSLSAVSPPGSRPRSPARTSAGIANGNRGRGRPELDDSSPVAVLGRILDGLPLPAWAEPSRPEELIGDIDFAGLSLEQFANGPASAWAGTDDSHEVDVSELQFGELHASINECDDVLESVESYLATFRRELMVVSAEIEVLQTRSDRMTVQMENRNQVRDLLNPVLEKVLVPVSVVETVTRADIGPDWIATVADLDHRATELDRLAEATMVKTDQPGGPTERESRLVSDMKPVFTSLINKAIVRIKDHLVAQTRALRVPGANSRLIQQNGFTAYRSLFAFLARRNGELAKSLTQAYVNTMRWYYVANFTRYSRALERVNVLAVSRTDVLARTDGLDKTVATTGPGRASAIHLDPFVLGRRLEMIDKPATSAISAYVAEEDRRVHFLELPFYAFNLALFDNGAFEYSFIADFFGPTLPAPEVGRIFQAVFGPTTALGRTMTDKLVSLSFDSIGILVAIRINQMFAFDMQRRKVPTMDDYINLTNILLWPRFQQVMDVHIEAMKKPVGPSVRSSAIALLSGTIGGGSSAASTAPHPLTQRFATFVHALLSLSGDGSDAEPVALSLARLRTEFEHAMVKISRSLADKTHIARFLHNNYQLVWTIIEPIENGLADQTKSRLAELMAAQDVDAVTAS